MVMNDVLLSKRQSICTTLLIAWVVVVGGVRDSTKEAPAAGGLAVVVCTQWDECFLLSNSRESPLRSSEGVGHCSCLGVAAQIKL